MGGRSGCRWCGARATGSRGEGARAIFPPRGVIRIQSALEGTPLSRGPLGKETGESGQDAAMEGVGGGTCMSVPQCSLQGGYQGRGKDQFAQQKPVPRGCFLAPFSNKRHMRIPRMQPGLHKGVLAQGIAQTNGAMDRGVVVFITIRTGCGRGLVPPVCGRMGKAFDRFGSEKPWQPSCTDERFPRPRVDVGMGMARNVAPHPCLVRGGL